jgi:RimJ/RimL family protein N-acetyltransferase
VTNCPPGCEQVLEGLVAGLPLLLGENLIGIYLYGSLTQGAFNPDRSDIDCIVVTQRELTDAQFTGLDHWLAAEAGRNQWMSRLQASFLVRDAILKDTAGGNCLYQFTRLKRVGSDGNPIIWLNVLETGVVLLGPPAESFVPPITPETLWPALVREVGYLRDEIVEKPTSEWRDVPAYRAYAVLTLCRILYTHSHGTVVSKPRAAAWALRNLPDTWHSLIEQALEGDADHKTELDLRTIARFIEFADVRLRSSSESVSHTCDKEHTDGVIVLSLFDRADAATLLEADSDPEHRRRFDFPDDFRPSLRHSEEVIARWEHERLAGKRFPYAVRSVTTGELLGGVELRPLGDGTANLSYWTSPRHRRRGVAARAVSLMCRVAFQELGFSSLQALVEEDNVASRRVVDRNGFREVSVQDGWVCYVLETPSATDRAVISGPGIGK